VFVGMCSSAQEIVLLGMQLDTIELGRELSATVESLLDTLVDTAVEQLGACAGACGCADAVVSYEHKEVPACMN
jgi:hypothetical protein